jgi:tetratricopeptide (TPR) repeat protein
MTAPSADFQRALEHLRAGRLAQAADIYQRLVDANPHDAEALHMLGIARLQGSQVEAAIATISLAVRINPGRAAFHNNLGEAHRAAGRLDEALQCFQDAIGRAPELAPAYYNLALVHHSQGDLVAAARRCGQALARAPNYADAHNLLGLVHRAHNEPSPALQSFARAVAANPRHVEALVNLAQANYEAGQFDQAVCYCEQALEVQPGAAELHVRLGDLLAGGGRFDAAADRYRQALEIDPRFALAECRWGVALQSAGDGESALVHFRRAVELMPRDAEMHANLAARLADLGHELEAIEHYRTALALEPAHAKALLNLGLLLQDRGEFVEALAHFDRGVARAPNDATIRSNRALMLLLSGDYRAGWSEYRWRTKAMQPAPYVVKGPEWDGTPMPGKILLVHGEQGLGDTLQFVRYVPLIRALGMVPILLVKGGLIPLLKQSGFEQVLAYSDPLPAFDARISLLDLPYAFGTTLETVPANVPYLAADPALVHHWAERIRPVDGFRVGICWQGSSAERSAPLAAFEPLARVPGVRLISLQKDAAPATVENKFPLTDFGDDLDRSGMFLDTAALIKSLDLVVTIDTAMAHLAGALGAPVWLALSARGFWRWLYRREDSPWYPTMRLFRQQKLRDWSELFERIAAELQTRVAEQATAARAAERS